MTHHCGTHLFHLTYRRGLTFTVSVRVTCAAARRSLSLLSEGAYYINYIRALRAIIL